MTDTAGRKSKTEPRLTVPDKPVDTASGAIRAWGKLTEQPGLLCLLLALVTLAIYLPVAHHEFVNYDDPDYVSANPHVQSGLSWANVGWAFRTGFASNWHPLTWMSHMLDWQLFGQMPGAHHLVSAGWHVLNAVLLFLVLRKMTGAHWRSALVAGLFALHPLHVESVAWVSERKDVLSTFFLLLTLGAYSRYVEGSNVPGGKPQVQDTESVSTPESKLQPPVRAEVPGSTRRGVQGSPTLHAPNAPAIFYALALICFALGLLSKPMLVTLPFLLLLLDYWPLRRFELSAANLNFAKLSGLIREKIPFFALSAASSVITFVVQRKGGAVQRAFRWMGASLTRSSRNARYLGDMFWPVKLSVLYPHPGYWPSWQVVASGALVLSITILVLGFARGRPYLPVGWLWFMGGLVPVIGLVQVGIQAMADRYTYVPIIGLFVALVWGLADLVPSWPRRQILFGLVGALALAACSWLTERQIQYWHDSEALFTRAVQVTSRNYLAYNNLGYYLSGKGNIPEAIKNYQRSLEINPAYEDALNNLGFALAGQGNNAEAIPLYEAALRVRPNHVEVHNNLGNALSGLGKIDEAIAHYRFALKQQPDHADAHNNLGIALAMQGKFDEAVEHFRAAIRAKPTYAGAHSNLGNALAVQHKIDEAIKEYRECLQLNPDDAQAHNNLGNALTEQGRFAEAIPQYEQALRLNARNPEAHFNLGLVLARQGKHDAAAAHYTEALRLKPDYAEAKRQLELLSTSK